MTLTGYLILAGAPFIGGLAALSFGNIKKEHLGLLLTFSGAFLFGITVLHLIPEAYHDGNHKTGLFILAGFFIQLLLEQFSHGAEHGHLHQPRQRNPWYLVTVMVALSIHSFIEGFPLGFSFHGDATHNSLLFAIALHKIPVAFVLVFLMLYFRLNSFLAVLLLILFSLMSPAGAFSAQILNQHHSHWHDYHSAVTAFVVGLFFHVSTTILFETGESRHAFNIKKAAAIITGACLSLLTYEII